MLLHVFVNSINIIIIIKLIISYSLKLIVNKIILFNLCLSFTGKLLHPSGALYEVQHANMYRFYYLSVIKIIKKNIIIVTLACRVCTLQKFVSGWGGGGGGGTCFPNP